MIYSRDGNVLRHVKYLQFAIAKLGGHTPEVGQYWMNLDRDTSEARNGEKRGKAAGNR
jgi:hypothetical protein